MATTPAAIALGTATGLEIVAYYVPWLDHALDALATPAALIAGVIATAAVVVDVPPLLRWAIALIGGGGAAGLIQGATVLLRAHNRPPCTAGTLRLPNGDRSDRRLDGPSLVSSVGPATQRRPHLGFVGIDLAGHLPSDMGP